MENMVYPNKAEILRILKDVQNGSLDYIKEFFEKYPFLHWRALLYDQTGDTIFHIAARLGNVYVILYLIHNFEHLVDCKNKDDKTALHEASQFGKLEICEILLLHHANVNAIKRGDWTPLMLACTKVEDNKNYEVVKLLLEHGALINLKNKDGWTCLHIISREGDCKILLLLLENGAKIKEKTKNGRSVLHIASLHGHLKVVQLLLKLGLNPNEKDNCGSTSLHEAIMNGHLDICKLLIDNGADVDAKNNTDYGILHLAAYQGHLNIIKFIIYDLKKDINETNTTNLSALHCAARKNQRYVYNFLISKGADPNLLDNFDRKPADYLPCIK